MLRPSFLSLLRGTQHPARLCSHPGLSCHVARKHGEQWLLCGTQGGGGGECETRRERGWTGIRERLVLTMRESKKKRKAKEKARERGETAGGEGAGASF